MKPIILNRDLYVPIEFLKKNYQVNEQSIHNGVSKYNKGTSRYYENIKYALDKRVVLIKFNTISPQLFRKYQIPSEDEIIKFIENSNADETYNKIRQWLDFAYEHEYKNYQKHYVGSFFDLDLIVSYARTHCLFKTILNLHYNSKGNSIEIKKMFTIYKTYELLQFETNNLKSFYHKLNEFKNHGYSVLINKNYGCAKSGKKVSEMHINKIKQLYRDKKQFTNREIHYRLNEWASIKGFTKLSISTVNQIIANPTFQNECKPSRNGGEWRRLHWDPYKIRSEVKKNGELWQMDGSRLQIAYINKEGKIAFLWYFVVMDVHSRKIVGYSYGDSENHKGVVDALKNAISTTKYVPQEILIDNGSCYKHQTFKQLELRMKIYGTYFRRHLPDSPRDKGHVERFFSTFQTTICKNESGYIGEGVKSRREEGRPSKARLNEELHPKNLRSKEQLVKLLGDLIEKYNNLQMNGKNLDPTTKFKIAETNYAYTVSENDFALMFWSKLYEHRIQKSMVVLTEGSFRNNTYSYTIDEEELRYRLNQREVTVCYSRENRKTIKIFDENENFITSLSLDQKMEIIFPKEKVDVKETKALLKELISKKPVPISTIQKQPKIHPKHQIYKGDASFEILLIKNKDNE